MPNLISFPPTWAKCANDIVASKLNVPAGSCLYPNELCYMTDSLEETFFVRQVEFDTYVMGRTVAHMSEEILPKYPPRRDVVKATVSAIVRSFFMQQLPELVTNAAQTVARNITAATVAAAAHYILHHCVFQAIGAPPVIAAP